MLSSRTKMKMILLRCLLMLTFFSIGLGSAHAIVDRNPPPLQGPSNTTDQGQERSGSGPVDPNFPPPRLATKFRHFSPSMQQKILAITADLFTNRDVDLPERTRAALEQMADKGATVLLSSGTLVFALNCEEVEAISHPVFCIDAFALEPENFSGGLPTDAAVVGYLIHQMTAYFDISDRTFELATDVERAIVKYQLEVSKTPLRTIFDEEFTPRFD